MIKIEGLKYIYGAGTPFERVALKNADFTLCDGEIVGLIGHTGSGKSTLVQHMNALLKPTEGKVFVDGVDIWAQKSVRAVRFNVGLVFQYPEYQLFEETIFKDIAFGVKNSGITDPGQITERVYSAMDFVHLPKETAEKSPFELSGGQKRRAAIAGVIAMMPKTLILDEPTAGLDPAGRHEILSHILAYRDATGSSVVLVTHSMDEIARLSDRIYVLNEGEIVASGTPREIFSRENELKEIGLSVPAVTQVFHRLRDAGIIKDGEILTLDEARKALADLAKIYGKVVPDA